MQKQNETADQDYMGAVNGIVSKEEHALNTPFQNDQTDCSACIVWGRYKVDDWADESSAKQQCLLSFSC